MSMKRIYVNTVICSIALILLSFAFYLWRESNSTTNKDIKIGFLYVGDESNPYTYNFMHAQTAIKNEFGKAATILVKNNVPEGEEDEPLHELAKEGCDMIITTSYGYSEGAKKIAAEFPHIQVCQATGANANEKPVYSNYHTFMGEIYQGRYISGIVAGMKLKELIDEKKIKVQDAKIGYVAAYPYAEVISGYTSFFLGVRSIVPQATMNVRYVNTWSSFAKEKKCAKKLIDEGCVIISQHSDTTGPAAACEETNSSQIVYHVGYNRSMLEVAPTTSIIGSRINWAPYMLQAVKAVMTDKKIEDCVEGDVNGNDIGAGFEENWVEMLELNKLIAAKGTQEKIEQAIQAFRSHECLVFKGDYIGVNSQDASDIYDLKEGYVENKNSSAPTFDYVLKDVINVEE